MNNASYLVKETKGRPKFLFVHRTYAVRLDKQNSKWEKTTEQLWNNNIAKNSPLAVTHTRLNLNDCSFCGEIYSRKFKS